MPLIQPPNSLFPYLIHVRKHGENILLGQVMVYCLLGEQLAAAPPSRPCK